MWKVKKIMRIMIWARLGQMNIIIRICWNIHLVILVSANKTKRTIIKTKGRATKLV